MWWTIGRRGGGIDRGDRLSLGVNGVATKRRRVFKLLGDEVFREGFGVSPSSDRNIYRCRISGS